MSRSPNTRWWPVYHRRLNIRDTLHSRSPDPPREGAPDLIPLIGGIGGPGTPFPTRINRIFHARKGTTEAKKWAAACVLGAVSRISAYATGLFVALAALGGIALTADGSAMAARPPLSSYQNASPALARPVEAAKLGRGKPSFGMGEVLSGTDNDPGASAELARGEPSFGMGEVLSGTENLVDAGLRKITPSLLAATNRGEQTSFLVILTEQAQLGSVAQLASKEAKSRAVYDTLRQVARRSQAPLRAWLDNQGVPYQGHYLVNMLAVQGDRALLLDLARRDDIASIVPNPIVDGLDPISFSRENRHQADKAPAGVEWGVAFVNAPRVWDTYGVAGEGTVIGGQDTGIQWDHPALIRQYRGWDGQTVDHNYNWHDAIGGNVSCPDPAVPCDDHGHGTHTIGTAAGDDGEQNHIGVAPGADWIGCRNMDHGNGSPSTYTECFEFLLAPYPLGGDPFTQGDPSLGADVISNSWYCPPGEGCDHFTLRQVVENVHAAGILVVASAGNNGSACESALYPIGTYDAAYSVGAVDSTGRIASFSSRGPVTFNGSGISKPDISAPGVSVRSAYPGNSYGLSSGTSMAAPHVAGVAALLWSANPALRGQIDETEHILNQTANHVDSFQCNSNGWPNHTYGYGHVDALAAVQAVREPARVQGQVSQLGCQPPLTTPVPEAQLTIRASTGVTTTVVTSRGAFSLTLPPGTTTITATSPSTGIVLAQTAWLLGNQDNEIGFTFARDDLRCLYLPLLHK